MENNKKEDLLLTVGERLFTRYGYKDVSVEDITKLAGLSTGSFYNYFTSKESFYNQLLDKIEQQGIQEANRIVARLQSPLNRLKALYRFTTLGIKNNQILRGILTGDTKYIFPGSEQRARRQHGLRHHIEGMIAEIIREGTRKRIFRSGIYKDPTLMVTSLYNTILINFDSAYIDDLIHDLLLLLQRGLRRWLRLPNRDERYDRRMSRKRYYNTM